MIKWFFKAATAGILALIILNIFCFFYYNIPVHSDNPTGATEYVFEPNKFYSRATEGFAFGFTNDEGFKNSYNISDVDSIEILLMGSSHMEAYQLSQKQNISDRLNEFFSGNKRSYNIGTSGHNLLYCVSHLESALSVYSPTEYVIIETSSIDFSEKDIKGALNHSLKKLESSNDGIIGIMQQFPYLRLIYSQYQNMRKPNPSETAPFTSTKITKNDTRVLGKLIDKISLTSTKHNVTPIILFHPQIIIDSDNHPYASVDENKLQLFQSLCEKNNIIFVDMTEIFIKNYKENYILPHGFWNTSAGEGHLNKYGHEMIAKKLYEIITEWEGN